MGVRAMTSTSGGGFSLMVEALGMAGMVEVPLVIVLAQRGGPSTGLPTRTEQGDLLFALHASQGEFPRIILAPGTIPDCFRKTWKAFNLAEKYQCPVILLTDQFLASSLRTLEWQEIDTRELEIDRGATILPGEPLTQDGPYQRYALTESGVSPRVLPGHPDGVYAMTTDEHTPESHISESSEVRIQMMTKRMRKLDTAVAEMDGPSLYGPEEAEQTLICWGSMYGPCREAVNQLNRDGIQVNMLHFSDLWPFPLDKSLPYLERIRSGIVVEQNYTGQFARFLRMNTGYTADRVLNKFDGRQFTPGEIASNVREAELVHG